MFADLDWPLNASRGFVSISWASYSCCTSFAFYICISIFLCVRVFRRYSVRSTTETWTERNSGSQRTISGQFLRWALFCFCFVHVGTGISRLGAKSIAFPSFTSLLPSIFLPSPFFSPFRSHPFPSIFLPVSSLPTPPRSAMTTTIYLLHGLYRTLSHSQSEESMVIRN